MICCYLLISNDSRRTYIGATIDFQRRLRQHNGEIVGGAKATKRGRPWRCALKIDGFETFQQALQFEWRFKRRTTSMGSALSRRIHSLMKLFKLYQWTLNAPPAHRINLTIKIFCKHPLIYFTELPSYIHPVVVVPLKCVECIGWKN